MKYRDLFSLENCLSDNLATYIHVEIVEETTYGKAFGVVGHFCNKKAKGLYIVVICEDEKEVLYLQNAIMNDVEEIKKSNKMLQTINEDIEYNLIIDVNEY